MTRDEAFQEMNEFRANGHIIVVNRAVTDGYIPGGYYSGEWTCTFDGVTTKAATPELAWMAAKSHRQDAGPK